jgi:DNA-binding transcriptional MerR regulator
MEYTIQKLAKLAGLSTRALRHYDAIGLLKPKRISLNGYRIYGAAELDQLQQILFYRELGVSLNEIKQVVSSSLFSKSAALTEHYAKIMQKRSQLDLLIANIEKSIALAERGAPMSDQEKFEGFKQKMIDDNERKYGREVRVKFGEVEINQSNLKMRKMSAEQHAALIKLSGEVNETLLLAFKMGDPGSELAMQACDLHKQWLMFFWPRYTKEAHMALAQMYVDDERFTMYYEKIAPGCTVFLRDAMRLYTGFKG